MKEKSIVKTLKNAAKIAFTWAKKNAVQFDDSKSELIHFESHKATLDQTIILLNNTIIKPKICVQWLEVWLNRKLNFRVYVQTKIAAVTRTLHSLFRLMNSEWKLNVKSENSYIWHALRLLAITTSKSGKIIKKVTQSNFANCKTQHYERYWKRFEHHL